MWAYSHIFPGWPETGHRLALYPAPKHGSESLETGANHSIGLWDSKGLALTRTLSQDPGTARAQKLARRGGTTAKISPLPYPSPFPLDIKYRVMLCSLGGRISQRDLLLGSVGMCSCRLMLWGSYTKPEAAYPYHQFYTPAWCT